LHPQARLGPRRLCEQEGLGFLIQQPLLFESREQIDIRFVQARWRGRALRHRFHLTWLSLILG
jgi:hypothetical protein